jgi:hypothetical protein
MICKIEFLLLPGFSTAPAGGIRPAAGIRRAGTIIRSPLEGRKDKGDKSSEADLRASEVR